ncbi:aminotransferase class I/II-fold pyridoxal phosphate-dependent enzyme [Candidatus Vidania fulgoroideorum]
MILNKNIYKINKYKIRKNIYKIYLDSMENNNFNNEKFKKKLLIGINKKKVFFNRYYFKSDINKAENSILKYNSLKKIKTIIGNGLDEIIFFICLISKNNVGSIEPTFSMYEKYSLLLNKFFFKFKLSFKKKITVNYKKLNRFIKKKNIDVFFLCYPNNPTGNIYNKKKILRIIKKNSNCLFVIDETYYDYSRKSFIKYVRKYNNIIILRTFSKIGFASLRIGYMLCRKKIYKVIKKIKLPYNINIFSLLSIPYIIKYCNNSKDIENILLQKRKLEFFFNKKNIFYYKSYCNFFLLKIKKSIFKEIEKKKILIKKMFKDVKKKYVFVRISIGNKYENNKLIRIFKDEKNKIN